MKILWVNPNFLHPTTKGGQIRTLEIVKRLHRRHEIHYVAFESPMEAEGPARSSEYSTRSYPVRHRVPSKNSPAFLLQLVAGLFSRQPVAVGRFYSRDMARLVEDLSAGQRFDRAVCDFLVPAPYFADLSRVVLFQHNVETMIWRRHAEHAADPLRRWYFRLQARRMFEFEGRVCRATGSILAVSDSDRDTMRSLFGAERVQSVPTGVDIEYFARRPSTGSAADLVFIGSMDWLPNIDGVSWFVREILPAIRRRRSDCTLAVVGRAPSPEILALAREHAGVQVTGTVADVRPYLWGAPVSIVPLRIGGGTRLKIYESMAAGTPVVSTRVGAEGLDVSDGENILLADRPDEFAARCVELLENENRRTSLGSAALAMVTGRFSWDRVAERFEELLEAGPAYGAPPITE